MPDIPVGLRDVCMNDAGCHMARTGGGRNTRVGFAVGGGASGGACSPDTRLPPLFPEMENWSTPAKIHRIKTLSIAKARGSGRHSSRCI